MENRQEYTSLRSREQLETSLLLGQGQVVHHSEGDLRSLPTIRKPAQNGLVITNVGSTARDHLANERTYLAWLRTSLALVGASLGLLKWDAVSQVTGYLVGFLGVCTLVTATLRYFRVMHLLEKGQYEPNVYSILIINLSVAVCVVVAYAMHISTKSF